MVYKAAYGHSHCPVMLRSNTLRRGAYSLMAALAAVPPAVVSAPAATSGYSGNSR